jgi:hypothetical protein
VRENILGVDNISFEVVVCSVELEEYFLNVRLLLPHPNFEKVSSNFYSRDF